MEINKIDNIRNIFINTLGVPDDADKLTEYLLFVVNYSVVKETVEYSEKHHILPRAVFKQYINDSWNIVDLVYTDHVFAHELLAQAYKIRKFIRTLNFMNSELSKNSEVLSIAAKKGWINLKNNKEVYERWREGRIFQMGQLSSEDQSNRSIKAWTKIKNDPDKYANRCKQNRENWTPALKLEKSKQMKEYFKNNPTESSKRGMKRWSSVNIEYKKKFGESVKKSLSNPIVKDKISSKLKDKWKDQAFINKMKLRKTSKQSYQLISPTGEIFNRTGSAEILNEFDFSPSLFRKFTNLNKPVESVYLKNKQVQNTIGWVIHKITNKDNG